MNNDMDNWEDNGIDSIDNRIDEVAVAELDGMESALDHINTLDDESFFELQDAMKELLDDCSKSNFKKVGKFLIKLMRKETEWAKPTWKEKSIRVAEKLGLQRDATEDAYGLDWKWEGNEFNWYDYHIHSGYADYLLLLQ